MIASPLIAMLFHEPQLTPIIGWLSPVFLLSALSSVQQAILRRALAFKSLTIRTLASVIGGGVVALIMAFLGLGVWSLVAKILVSGLVNAVALWQVSDWRPKLRFSTKRFKEMFSYGINIVGGNFVDFFSLHSDDFLIGYFLGPVVLGYYTLAYNLLIVMTDLLVAVPNAVAFPVFSSIQSDLGKTKQAFYEVTQLQSAVAFPVFLGMLAVSSEVVTVLYGTQWIPSIPVVQVLMLIGIVRSIFYFCSSVFKSAVKPSWRFGIWTLNAVLNVIGFIIVVRMGIVAVAISYVVVSYIILPLYLLMIRKLIRVSIRTYLFQYIPATLSSMSMLAVVFLIKLNVHQSIVLSARLAILIITGGIVYLSALRLIRPSLFKQIREFAQMAVPSIFARQA
jgi:PST family polysaccharide transporter